MSTASAALTPAFTHPMRSWARCSRVGRRRAFTARHMSSTAVKSSASAERTCSSAPPSSRCAVGSTRSDRRRRWVFASSVKASRAARAIPIGTAATAASTNGIAGNAYRRSGRVGRSARMSMLYSAGTLTFFIE